MSEYEQLSFDFMTGFEDTGKFVGRVGIFKTKVCTICKKELEATRENFTYAARNQDKLHTWCKTCNSINSMLRRKIRIKNGLCTSCDSSKLENSTFCEQHHIESMLRSQIRHGRFNQLKTKNKITEFATGLKNKLHYQNYSCAISGDILELGVNASIDHIQEFSSGGSCNLENIQWVTKKANNTKPRKHKNENL